MSEAKRWRCWSSGDSWNCIPNVKVGMFHSKAEAGLVLTQTYGKLRTIGNSQVSSDLQSPIEPTADGAAGRGCKQPA